MIEYVSFSTYSRDGKIAFDWLINHSVSTYSLFHHRVFLEESTSKNRGLCRV